MGDLTLYEGALGRKVGEGVGKGEGGGSVLVCEIKKKLLNKKITKNERAMHAYMYVKVSSCSEMLQVVWQYFQR